MLASLLSMPAMDSVALSSLWPTANLAEFILQIQLTVDVLLHQMAMCLCGAPQVPPGPGIGGGNQPYQQGH